MLNAAVVVKRCHPHQGTGEPSTIHAAGDGLTPAAATDLSLTILHNDMQAIIERYISV
jgi:hypothetical protein